MATYSCTGGHGTVELSSLTVQDAKGKECKVKDGCFQPQKSGDYTVSYQFRDYLGNMKKTEYQVSVTNSTNPILDTEAVLPMALLSDETYTLPELTAYDYSKGDKNKVTAEVWVKDAAGERRAENRKYTVSGNTGDVANITYLFKTNKGELKKTYDIPIRKLTVGDASKKVFDVANLIVPTAGTIVPMEGSEYYWMSAKQDTSFYFANDLLADVFALDFNIGHLSNGKVSGTGVEKVRISLTDSEQRDKAIYIDLEKNPEDEKSLLMSVNSGMKYVVSGSFSKNTNYTLGIQYNGQTQMIRSADGLDIQVTTYANGDDFKGFTSGKVYCTVDLKGVSKEGVLMEMISINGQPLTAGEIKDKNAPNFALTGTMKVCHSLNASVKIPKAVVSDVLSMKTHVKVTVETPAKGDYYYVSLSNVLASQLDQAYTLTIKKGESESMTLTYSAYTNIKAILDGDNYTTATKNMMEALYRYGEAADAYNENRPSTYTSLLYSTGMPEGELKDDGNYDTSLFYRNDNISGLQFADAQVIYISDTESTEYGSYYMYGTNNANGIEAYKSKDFQNWENMTAKKGMALEKAEGMLAQKDFWAPEVIYDETDDKYYMFYSGKKESDTQEQNYICVAEATEPYGPFLPCTADGLSASTPLLDTAKLDEVEDITWNVIDASPFVDSDGSKYLYFCAAEWNYDDCWGIKMNNWTSPDYATLTKVMKTGYKTADGTTKMDYECGSSGVITSARNEAPQMYKYDGN